MPTNEVVEATNVVSGLDFQSLVSKAPQWIESIKELVAKFGLKILAAIVIFVVGRWVVKILRGVLQSVMERAKVDAAIIGFSCSMAHAVMMLTVVAASLKVIGFDTTSIITILGAAGLAVGLALRDSLSNFASGVMILIFRPFKVGDFVEGGGATGVIKEIHIFTTTLTSPDNKRVIVPNAKMMGDNIINYSAESSRRVDLVACISYDDDIDKAKAAMMDVAVNNPLVLKDPAPFVGVLAMNDSSIDLAVRPYVKPADYWPAFFALNEAIKKRLEAEGCTIPFPQQDVHFYKHEG